MGKVTISSNLKKVSEKIDGKTGQVIKSSKGGQDLSEPRKQQTGARLRTLN